MPARINRSTSYSSFINNLANFSVNGATLGNPTYFTGTYPTGTDPLYFPRLGSPPTAPPSDLGITPKTKMVATALVNIFVNYAQEYSRVRQVTHITFLRIGGTFVQQMNATRPTALNATYITNSGMAPLGPGAGIIAGNTMQQSQIDSFATNLGSLIANLPGETWTSYYCHSNCFTPPPKSRSRR
jgi:hypothetical protein